jgi:hypothetical protein
MEGRCIRFFPPFFDRVMFIIAVKIAFVVPVIAVFEEDVFCQQRAIQEKDHPGQEKKKASLH